MSKTEIITQFHDGICKNAYEFFSPKCENGSWRFRVWAPSAKAVSVVGDFNGWVAGKNPMTCNEGIWECKVPNAKEFDNYKFEISSEYGTVLKSDPYAYHYETAPANASKLYDLSGFEWHDKKWLDERRNAGDLRVKPMNIYEVHIGSWKRYSDGNVFSYEKFADEIVPYVKAMNYTHIELLPVTEYPFDDSWGYQVTGMFAPTSRYGTPKGFMKLVDKCHKAGIGVILDWVASHFPKDEFGLFNFDGTHLYEYSDPLKMEHKGWGTAVYDYSKPEVRSFLLSSANFFMEKYHVDGIRVDAVASMLYLDYGREKGEWRPNMGGGNYNLEAIDFLKQLNKSVLTDYPGAITVAEESTAFPLVTAPPDVGGLGFNFKWNMGWMNDSLDYLANDPYFRQFNHNKMTFSITYAYSENYILPLSHDEVVHGKYSLINKIQAAYEDKFECLKTYLGFYMAHPGKKLSFMGNEFAQFIEWNCKQQLDWLLLGYETHAKFHAYVSELNKFYLKNKPMYENDCDGLGFEWLVVDDNTQNVFAFKRTDKEGNAIICITNFSPVDRKDYRIGVPEKSAYKLAFTSVDDRFGKRNMNAKTFKTANIPWNGRKQSISIDIPAYSVIYIK